MLMQFRTLGGRLGKSAITPDRGVREFLTTSGKEKLAFFSGCDLFAWIFAKLRSSIVIKQASGEQKVSHPPSLCM